MNKFDITVIDYGMGNLWSVFSALSFLGCNVKITRDPVDVIKADSLILPGVGSFRKAMESIKNKITFYFLNFILE